MNRFRKLAFLTLFIPLFLSGCIGSLLGGSSDTMTILAGSEVKDLQPLVEKIERETGIQLEFEYIGTLNGAESLMGGAEYDLAWFSHGKYLTLLQGGRGIIETQERIMLSPVVLGVKRSTADRLGWTNNDDITWEEIAETAAAGELRYAMTNPAASNSGFTALVGVASALADNVDALESGDINVEGMKDFFRGQAITSGSSGWLAESYVTDQDLLDGMINYESVLLALNQSGQLREELVMIYPQEGIITADYPLMLLNNDKREAYDTLVAYLKTPEMQEDIMRTTLRRPVVPGVALDNRIPDPLLIELPFPNTLSVIDNLLFSYLDEQRIPSHAFFVLDVSGSMRGEGIRDLKNAMVNLTGLDSSITGQFARFRGREKVTIITFNDRVQFIQEFEIDDTNPDGNDMQEVRSYVQRLDASGGTAIYDALNEAYRRATVAKAAEPERFYSIVLMSDGENTDGAQLNGFVSIYNELPPEAQSIRTFPVLFGNADEDSMQQVAKLTNGRLFDGRSGNLSSIFKTIRGYQ